jgi:tyrosyl-tRNA synthetase
MTKAITDEKLIDEFLERGVAEVFPNKEGLKKRMMTGEPMKVYCGFDPSAPSLHIGHAIQLNKLGEMQRLGHKIIFLIGDFTGMIGDPTDKSAARKKLTREEVLENAKEYQKQAAGYLAFDGENPAEVKYNSQWSDKLSFKDLIEASSNFTVQQMIQRDMFQKRIEEQKPIYLHEFLYPLAQGYDSVAMDVDMEVGGSDQIFNMLCGRDLMKAMKQKEKFVLGMKLLADDKGKKMGKTEGNAVFLDQTPENMYGAVMSWPDGMVGIGFELCTQISMTEVKAIYKKLKDPAINPRDLKMKLAFELVKINHGEKKAKEAEEYFVKTIQKKEIPEHVVEWATAYDAHQNILDYMVSAGLASSKSDARRKVEQGGAYIDGERVVGIRILSPEIDNGKILKVGKKDFRRIVFK